LNKKEERKKERKKEEEEAPQKQQQQNIINNSCLIFYRYRRRLIIIMMKYIKVCFQFQLSKVIFHSATLLFIYINLQRVLQPHSIESSIYKR
jgi:hypothetical protein